MSDKIYGGRNPGGEGTTDTCDHGLSRIAEGKTSDELKYDEKKK